MSVWVRDSNSKWLNRIETHLNNTKLEPEIKDNKIGEVKTLNDTFYPPTTLRLHVLIYRP